ncbi:excinuclease ABC subunit C [Blastopirellula marina]|uniref:Excinuclease ABC subunit C n=1 Tax=Blastopirellula marina TaxID=124 RepID=A0A2S8G4D3_9BACT|nr:excinuclease ABC subunit C [Blastopirellula marina]RCS55312.1 GIY-YIG nuclease family protein [Bremerella cremea]
MDVQKFRDLQLRQLTNDIGVYALCDLDGIPIYVGQSTDGIRSRVRRHLTSARSDVIANRQIDVWEVAFVWAWPVQKKELISSIESWLFNEFDNQSRLMNGSTLNSPSEKPEIPEKLTLSVLSEEEITRRKEPRLRFPRQVQQLAILLDYILETSDKAHLRRSLMAHFERLERYYQGFI